MGEKDDMKSLHMKVSNLKIDNNQDTNTIVKSKSLPNSLPNPFGDIELTGFNTQLTQPANPFTCSEAHGKFVSPNAAILVAAMKEEM